MEATSNFDGVKKIGSGEFGCVYKAQLRHTSAAVKLLCQVCPNYMQKRNCQSYSKSQGGEKAISQTALSLNPDTNTQMKTEISALSK